MKKPRHIKTIGERFGEDPFFPDKESIDKYKSETVKAIREWQSYHSKKAVRTKTEFKFDLEECMRQLHINYKGIMYLEALGAYDKDKDDSEQTKGKFIDGKWCGYGDYNDAYFIQYDDTPMKRVKLKSDFKQGDKEYMEYTKYFIMKVSLNGWYLLFFQDRYNNLDWVVRKNDILIQGNVGTLVD